MESPLNLPESLRNQLRDYRRRLWSIKLIEAVAGACIGLIVGFLAVFFLDRFRDTPAWLRTIIFAASVLTCSLIPLAIERWVLRRRRLDQLARLLSTTNPRVGDQLLGVIELSDDASEQHRSPELVRAAIHQVAKDVSRQDLRASVPEPRHRSRVSVVACLLFVVAGLAWFTTSAALNAWARFVTPWSDVPRYTFASIESLPERLVVAHGEPFDVSVQLDSASRWKPDAASVSLDGGRRRNAELIEDAYKFELPGQIKERALSVRVGDFQRKLPVVPLLRPELIGIDAEIQLPKYLGRDASIRQAIRNANLSVVRGGNARFHARSTRRLADAWVNGQVVETDATEFSSGLIDVQFDRSIEIQWEDEFGLRGKEGLELQIRAVDDEAPTVVCENLPRRKVLLESEVLAFQVRARDDFGVKRVGIEWWTPPGSDAVDELSSSSALTRELNSLSATKLGERIIAGGHSEAEILELAATFCARDEQVDPQQIVLRVFVEDYLPGRERSYGPECLFQILDPSEHAIWVMSQLRRWHRMSLDVRDREMRLHETNKQLRQLDPAELAAPENLERLARQADQERANGRQLAGLVRSGESLLAEAMRNEDIGVGNLQSWAEMMQVLKDISQNRMPNVADLLKQASKSAGTEVGETNQSPQVGQNRLDQTVDGGSANPSDEQQASNNVPSVSDVESTQNQFSDKELKESDNNNPSKPRLSLAATQLAGNGNPSESSDSQEEEGPLDDAVREQQDLLSEFEKVAGDLNDVLANLEGSTLVKRLKASARRQQRVAGQLASLVSDSFGVSDREKEADAKSFLELAEQESLSSQDASNIMDDMSAYFERSRYDLFKRVLDDMRKQDVTAELRILGEELRKENGLAIAQAEYWSDTFDRWAEDLVEATQAGAAPGAKAKDSLPPSVVLEVLQLLEGEVKLREQTRVAEQARPAVDATEHTQAANRLSLAQNEFQGRMVKVIDRILDLPEAEANFSNELNLLGQVSEVMKEATEILAKPETGPPAIAAETEIIELLLKSKRFNPQAGGGGGSNPGGGGTGKTETPALALVGSGLNSNEVREEMSATQSTGAMGPGLPEEFRHGLDQYFNQLEEWGQR